MGRVPLPPPAAGGGSSAAGDGADDGEDVEEDEKEATEGGEQAEGEGEEDATGGGPEQDVVAEEEHFVRVVLRGRHVVPAAADHRQPPHPPLTSFLLFVFYNRSRFWAETSEAEIAESAGV